MKYDRDYTTKDGHSVAAMVYKRVNLEDYHGTPVYYACVEIINAYMVGLEPMLDPAVLDLAEEMLVKQCNIIINA